MYKEGKRICSIVTHRLAGSNIDELRRLTFASTRTFNIRSDFENHDRPIMRELNREISRWRMKSGERARKSCSRQYICCFPYLLEIESNGTCTWDSRCHYRPDVWPNLRLDCQDRSRLSTRRISRTIFLRAASPTERKEVKEKLLLRFHSRLYSPRNSWFMTSEMRKHVLKTVATYVKKTVSITWHACSRPSGFVN